MIPTDPRIQAGMVAEAEALRAALAGGARRLGWKAGLGTAAVQARLGTTMPLTGFMTDATLFADGATVSIEGWANPVFEAEVAVRLGADVAPDATRETIIAAVEAIAPAIELVDSRPGEDVEDVLKANIYHRAVLLGDWVSGADLDGARLDVRIAGEQPRLDVDPRETLGDLALVVAAIAAQAPLASDALRAGDVVITGSPIGGIPVAPGIDAEVLLVDGPAVRVAIV